MPAPAAEVTAAIGVPAPATDAPPEAGSSDAVMAPPPRPPPPGAAVLAATSECSPSCVIPRGGGFKITIINTGGQPGRFTVKVNAGLEASPSRGSVEPGTTSTVDVVDTAKKNRTYTVEVRGPNGTVIFTATVEVRR